MGWLSTIASTLTSPLGPPFVPGSPSSGRFTACPLSIPAGMVTDILLRFDIYPVPWQFWHFSFITSPEPPQSGHVWTFLTIPKRDLDVYTTCPLPLHLLHFSFLVPGLAPLPLHVVHSSFRVISSSFSQPNMASSKVMLTRALRFAPFMGPLLLAPLAEEDLPPPKRSPNISLNISVKSMLPKSKPP